VRIASRRDKNEATLIRIAEQIGAYVMLLNNSYNAERELVYANGDTGVVEKIERIPRAHKVYADKAQEELQGALETGLLTMQDMKPKHSYVTPFADLIEEDVYVWVRISRRDVPEGKLVCVSPIVRELQSVSEPPVDNLRHPRFPRDAKGKPCQVTLPSGEKGWVDGQIRYFPMRLAWYTTCHKAQGLTFDTIQIDISNRFFSHPALMYTALSRCRTPDGLYIVGTPIDLAMKTVASKEILEWL
jgi:hypothetical protein